MIQHILSGFSSFIRSIRFKIIVLYMLILTLTLGIFSVALFYYFSERLLDYRDGILLSKADGLADSIQTYWDVEKLEAERVGRFGGIYSKINEDNFKKIAENLMDEKAADPKMLNIVVQLFDIHGQHILSSKHIPGIQVLQPDILNQVLDHTALFNNISVKDDEGVLIQMRQLTFALTYHNKVVYIAQVSTPLNTFNKAQNTLRTLLFIFLPLTVVLTGIVGALLAKITLNPIDLMVKTIRETTAHNLFQPIHVPKTRDEIQLLAETFNGLLLELNKVFSSQTRFIQDVSHELRTPLTVLKGEISVILKKVRSTEEYQEVMMSSLEEIDILISITETLLVLAKLDSDQTKIALHDVDFSEIIKSAIKTLAVLAENKNIVVTSLISENMIVMGDELYLTRLVQNLIDNAIKYTPQKGSIHVVLCQKTQEIILTVSDSGYGIAEKDLPYIFDRFFRADLSRHSTGYGLGLSIVKAIVEMHSGMLAVTSVLNKGTEFTIRLPVVAEVG